MMRFSGVCLSAGYPVSIECFDLWPEIRPLRQNVVSSQELGSKS